MIEKSLYNYLKTKTEITNLVSTRIYTAQLPEKINYPCLLLSSISSNEFSWNTPVSNERIQFSCFSKGKQGYIESKELSDNVILVLNQYIGDMGNINIININFDNRIQNYESDLDVYLWATDFFIKYKK